MASLNKASLASSVRAVREVAQGRRARRVVIGLLIFVVVVGLLGFFAAPPLIRHIAEQQLSQQLDRPSTIGRISLNPYTLRLEADRVHIGERGGQGDFVDVERMVVKPSWSSLFRLAPIIDELRLDSPRIHIVRNDAQHFNFSDLVDKFTKGPPKPDSKPTLFSVSNIQVQNGSITFDDKLLKTQHVIDRWSLGIPFIATLPSKTDIFVQPQLRARIDGSPLAIDGKTKPFAASRESDVSLRFDGLDLPRLLSYVPTKLPVTMQSGRLSTDLDLTFVMSGDAPALTVKGTVDLADADVRGANDAPFFAARAVHVAAASLEPLKSVYRFDEIRIDAPRVDLARDREGVLSVQRMFAPAADPASAKPAGVASPAAVASGASTAGAVTTPAPLDLSIHRFALNDGTVNVHDEAASRPLDLGLRALDVTLQDFSTLAKTPARYTLDTHLKGNDGTLAATGGVTLAAKNADAKLDLKALPLAPLQPYLDTLTAAQITDGALSANVDLHADWGKSPPDIQIGASQLALQSLKVAAKGNNVPAIALAQAQVAIKRVDVPGRRAEIDSVQTTGLAIDATRQKGGSIDLASLAGPHETEQQHTAIHAAKQAQAQGPAWHYTIGEFALKDGRANFTDNAAPRPVKLTVAPIQLKVQQISDDLTRPLPVDLNATLNGKGSLAVKGDVTATPLKLAMKVDANRLDVAAFEPYFGGKLNATLASALLNANGDVQFAQTGKTQAAPKVTYHGDASLVDVRLIDRVSQAPFAGWGSLALTNLKANYDERGADVDAGRVTFSKFYGRVLLDPQGKLNLTQVVAHDDGSKPKTREPIPLSPDAAAAPESASVVLGASAPLPPPPAPDKSASAVAANPAPKSNSPVKLHFGELVLQQGRVNYTDNFIRPNFSANLIDIKGTVGAFGTQSTTSAPVDVAARLSGSGPISIRGNVNPLIAKPALDLTASAHDVELTNLTPYSSKYAGYPITKGKLNVDLHYKLDNDQLTANNHLFIDQLTFGDHVDNDTATKLPVRLAISLLKNSRGEIDVNIPVSGSLSNPEFSIGGLIWHAVLNLLERAVTAPFTLLSHAFGGSGGGEDMGYVEFEPGSAKLTDASTKKLDTIAKALADKQSVKIDVTGRVDPAVDTPALRERYVDRLVRQQKIRDTVGNGQSVDVSSVTVDPKEYSKYLTKVYKDADFKKPTNFIGMTKGVPDDDMKHALQEHATIDEAALRTLAQRRAQAVQQYFDGKIDGSRVFVVAPKLNADGIKDKGAATRVEFGLQQ